MTGPGLQQSLTRLLAEVAEAAGYHEVLLCTDDGLPIASSSRDWESSEILAGVTSLFDEIVARAGRDLGMPSVDEVSLLDPDQGRLVVRPIGDARSFFLVVRLSRERTWRRHTNRLCLQLGRLLISPQGA